MSDSDGVLNDIDIRRMLPHRYPFLLLDRVVALEPGRHISAYKNVTVNEPWAAGHFPEAPVMPGVLILESMAQAGGVLAHESESPAAARPLFYLVGVDEARFRHPVFPGDRLDIELTVDRVRRGMWRFSAAASVAGRTAAAARIMTAPGSAR